MIKTKGLQESKQWGKTYAEGNGNLEETKERKNILESFQEVNNNEKIT